MKKLLTLTLLCTAISFCFLSCSKEGDVLAPGTTFTSGGIYYKVTSSAAPTVAITYTPNETYGYSGSVRIPNMVNYHDVSYSITSIGPTAFANCEDLTSIVIPNFVTSIEAGAFYGCSLLKNITIGSSVKSIGDLAFGRCASITSITIPSSVTSIGDNAFDRCSSLELILIPSSVTRIGDNAFAECYELGSLSIPSSVTRIGDWAFAWCNNLSSIRVYHATPIDANSARSVFYNVNTNTCVLHVPIGTKSLYAAANGWNSFTHIVDDITISNN